MKLVGGFQAERVKLSVTLRRIEGLLGNPPKIKGQIDNVESI